jgi:DNA helicase HerA-like ATPase
VHVIGHQGTPPGPVGRLGVYRARDGSEGEAVGLDLGGPHAALVVGKRGSGKSYTLGVLAEELARADGLAPVVLDPMGEFAGLAEGVPATVAPPRLRADALGPRAWPELLGLEPTGDAGGLVWRAAADRSDLEGMVAFVEGSDAPDAVRRAARNHLDLARSWGVFGAGGSALLGPEVTVLDCARLGAAPTNAACRAVATELYRARVAGRTDRLPWLLVDEAHVLFEGVAAPALRRLLTRGRGPGVSLVAATQRPSTLPEVAASQADLLAVHRLTSGPDRQAIERARPAYATESLLDRMPTRPGDALVVDDATERVHAVRVRERDTPHGGASPRVDDG